MSFVNRFVRRVAGRPLALIPVIGVAGLAALIGGAALRSPARAQARQPTPANVFTVGGTSVAPPIPAGFTGLSFELTALETFAGHDPHALNPVFEQLIRNISQGGQPVIRMGGDTSDWSWYPVRGMGQPPWVRYTLNQNWLAVTRALVSQLNARLIVGLNLEAGNARIAQSEANALVKGIGARAIDALELGNEPELYAAFNWYRTKAGVGIRGRGPGWGFPAYSSQFGQFAGQLPHVPLAGPAVGSPKWSALLGPFLAAHPQVKVATLHRYPLLHCPGHPAVTAQQLLSTSSTDGLANGVAPYVAVARRHGAQLRIAEMNAISCGGQRGLSDTFATALWSLDALFALAKVGVSGVNIHTTPGSANAMFSTAQARTGWSARVHPLYYGLDMFAQAAPAGSRILKLAGTPSPALRVWATRGTDGSYRVLVTNTAPAGVQAVTFTVPGQTQPGALERLTAPGLSATGGVRIAGQSFGTQTTSGLPSGRASTITVPLARGRYAFTVPAASAALLTLTPKATGPTGPTGSRGSTGATGPYRPRGH
ncbi:MAG: glycosyl hydrolase family 79 C-terminal domain-containing protein [Solirubrobacteraceae bacterium]